MIKLEVFCDLEGHLVGTWYNQIEEKYPFYCDECDDDLRMDKWPWKLVATLVEE